MGKPFVILDSWTIAMQSQIWSQAITIILLNSFLYESNFDLLLTHCKKKENRPVRNATDLGSTLPQLFKLHIGKHYR